MYLIGLNVKKLNSKIVVIADVIVPGANLTVPIQTSYK